MTAQSVNPKALDLPGVREHPKDLRPRRMTWPERLYLPLLRGLGVTMRHMLQNLFGLRRRNRS